jgi:hypothetical protein
MGIRKRLRFRLEDSDSDGNPKERLGFRVDDSGSVRNDQFKSSEETGYFLFSQGVQCRWKMNLDVCPSLLRTCEHKLCVLFLCVHADVVVKPYIV